MDCLDTRKVIDDHGSCCLGVMPMYAAYKSYQSHVQAKGDKASANDTEAEFAKQMKLCGIIVCPKNGKYPYYHKHTAKEYCGDFHSIRPVEQNLIMVAQSLYRQAPAFSSSSNHPPAKRQCGQFISADADI